VKTFLLKCGGIMSKYEVERRQIRKDCIGLTIKSISDGEGDIDINFTNGQVLNISSGYDSRNPLGLWLLSSKSC